MKNESLIVILFFSLLISCDREEHSSGQLLDLCSYTPKSSIQQADPCNGNIFVLSLGKSNGVIRWNDDLRSYTLSSSVNGTFDCTIIGLLCSDFLSFEGKSVTYTANVYEYQGNYDFPIAGYEMFLFKNVDIVPIN